MAYHDDAAKQHLLAPWNTEINRRAEGEEGSLVALDPDAPAEEELPESRPATGLSWLWFAILGGILVVVICGALLVYTRPMTGALRHGCCIWRIVGTSHTYPMVQDRFAMGKELRPNAAPLHQT